MCVYVCLNVNQVDRYIFSGFTYAFKRINIKITKNLAFIFSHASRIYSSPCTRICMYNICVCLYIHHTFLFLFSCDS